jgi:GTPase
VGKSTIFNRFVGKRQAIVEDRARTTRDRMYGDMEWNGRRFVLIDTGGLEVDTDDPIEIRVQEQARLAIREADVILFVVDAISGLTPADQEAAELLRTAKAPLIVAVNKVDNTQREADAAEFWSMGWEETYSISASHGRGTGDLLDAIVWALPPETEAELARKNREDEADEWAREVDAGRLEPYVVGDVGNAVDPTEDEEAEQAELDRFEGGQAAGGEIEARWDAAIEAESDDVQAAIAFVGRPNVGKSSLLNSLLGEDRAIVSDIPGTTRDAVDTTLEWGRSEIVLIDTAGIRRRGKVANGPAAEKYSTLRALKAIARADVAVLVIDAVEGLTAQDAHVAGYVVDEGKGLVIAVNKWDLVEDKTDRTFAQYTEWIRSEVPFLEFAPLISISAKTGQRVGKVLEMAIDIWGERRKRISTGELNRVIRAAVERQTPPVVKGRRPKVFYGTQAAVAPPTFVFFANDAALIHFSYRRYIENRLREEFGFDGTPIKLVFRDRESVKLPRRRSAGKSPVSKGPSAKRPASGGLRPKR